MKDTLTDGIETTDRYYVDIDRTISFMGEEFRVYATPSLVRDMEYTCRNSLLEHLDENEDSVGTFVNIEHLAATPLGMWVEITVKLSEVDGRRVTFEMTARDAVDDVIGRGSHGRFVVDKAKTAERIAAKRNQAEGG